MAPIEIGEAQHRLILQMYRNMELGEALEGTIYWKLATLYGLYFWALGATKPGAAQDDLVREIIDLGLRINDNAR